MYHDERVAPRQRDVVLNSDAARSHTFSHSTRDIRSRSRRARVFGAQAVGLAQKLVDC